MRVLFLASTFHPKIGGAESYALNLTRGLAALGHKIEIVTDRSPGETDSLELSTNISLKRLHLYRDRAGAQEIIPWEEMAFGLLPELAEIAAAFRPDVIMSNSLDLCVPAKLTSLTTGAPWVATFHEQSPERDPMGEAILHLSYRLVEPHAVIAGSRFYFARAEKYARPNRCQLVYHGIDTERFRPLGTATEVRAKYAIAPDATLIVSLGRFKARKGFLDLIQACASLKQNGQPIALIIAGSLNSASAAYLDEMRSLIAASDLGDLVHIEDALSHDRAAWLLSGSDIVVQASLEEGLGLAIIEAMACGRPVVATRIPAHREIIDKDDVALLVEPGQPDQLASALTSLINEPRRRRRLGEHARTHVVRKFSRDTMAAATARLLECVISDRNGHD
jgi:glycosyltransferase involved in cell wall biosynthesis